MGRSDARGLGGSVLIKEKVAPETTLLATEKQFIAMQVNREDTAKLQTNGRSAVESLINIEDESTYTKKEQFAALYENSWPQIIELLRPKPLTELLTNRFQYGIPYTQVKELVFRKTFINAGVRIYLTDGSFVTYTGFAPKRIDCLLPAIAGKVRTRPAKYPLFIW